MTETCPRRIVWIAGLGLTVCILAGSTASAQWSQLGADIHGEASEDWSGNSVSLSADGLRVAIGARRNDGINGVDSGHVRVFGYVPGPTDSWVQIGDDIDGEAQGDFFGQSVSLSADGTRLAVGGSHNDGNGSDSGHVQVFEYIPSPTDAWLQMGDNINGSVAGDLAGGSVSLSTDPICVAVGAGLSDYNGTDSGQVRVFRWFNSSWVLRGEAIYGEAPDDRFGSSVALAADCRSLAIGAPFYDGLAVDPDSGHVRVYFWNTYLSRWLFTHDIVGEVGGNRSGTSVSLSADGSRVAIGAPFNDGNGYHAGHATVYEWSSPSWDQLGQDIEGEDAGDNSGSSVSLSADGLHIAIGAHFNDDNGIYSGHVRVYRLVDGGWDQVGQDIDGESMNDHSGSSVSISADGSRVAIGSPGHYGSGALSGQVRIYTIVVFADGFESNDTSAWSVTLP